MISRRILVLGDIHYPYEHKPSIALAHKVVKAWKPDTIISIGDALDCYSISDYPRDPRRVNNLKAEAATAAKGLAAFKAQCDEFYITLGNHEFRFEKYLRTKAPELYGIVTMRELLGLSPREVVPYHESLKLGKTYFTHEVGYCGVGAAAKSLAAFGGNLVFGHSHKPEIVYSRNLRNESHFAMNVGWLGNPEEIDYAHRRKARGWQHGVGLVTQDAAGNSWATFVPFVGRKAIVEDQVISL